MSTVRTNSSSERALPTSENRGKDGPGQASLKRISPLASVKISANPISWPCPARKGTRIRR